MLAARSSSKTWLLWSNGDLAENCQGGIVLFCLSDHCAYLLLLIDTCYITKLSYSLPPPPTMCLLQEKVYAKTLIIIWENESRSKIENLTWSFIRNCEIGILVPDKFYIWIGHLFGGRGSTADDIFCLFTYLIICILYELIAVITCPWTNYTLVKQVGDDGDDKRKERSGGFFSALRRAHH